MNEQTRIFVPTGGSAHLEAIIEFVPDDCVIEFNDFSFEDGHREGTISFPNGERYSVDQF